MSAMSSLQRFEEAIELSDRSRNADTPSIENSHYESPYSLIGPNRYELFALGSQSERQSPVIAAQDITIGWPEYPAIQENISFNLMPSQFAIIFGGIGSGKSTLLKAIIGQCLVLHGSISATFDHAAYCCQNPWLMNKSVRDNICTNSEYDPVWFNTVVDACSLTIDIEKMPFKDQTWIGSKGMRLSGGQRKRIVWPSWSSYLYPI